MLIVGHLDICGPDMVEGWIFAPEDPGLKFDLEVFADGDSIGDCVADRFRRDVRDAGRGDGFSGFHFRVPKGTKVEHFASVRLRAQGSVLFLLPDDGTTISDRTQVAAAAFPLSVVKPAAAHR